MTRQPQRWPDRSVARDERGLSADEALRLAKLRLTLSGEAIDALADAGLCAVEAGISRHPWASLAGALVAGGLAGRTDGIGIAAGFIRLLSVSRFPARRPRASSRRCRYQRP
ncbi:MAG: hypothetical protein ACLFMY_02320 [Guyparkeria sp.]|uniref:hypothetical protein n=1 Tax=Guyparkeria sp. TaxID=2035736 RepID=UPI00397AE5C2